LYNHASFGERWPKSRSTIWLGENGIGQIMPDFAHVDIEGTNHFDISGGITTNFWERHAYGFTAIGFAISEALDERARAIANSNHGDSDHVPKVTRFAMRSAQGVNRV
jgi:hypothetical protein